MKKISNPWEGIKKLQESYCTVSSARYSEFSLLGGRRKFAINIVFPVYIGKSCNYRGTIFILYFVLFAFVRS